MERYAHGLHLDGIGVVLGETQRRNHLQYTRSPLRYTTIRATNAATAALHTYDMMVFVCRPTFPSVKSDTLILPVSPELADLVALRRSLPARSTNTILPKRLNCETNGDGRQWVRACLASLAPHRRDTPFMPSATDSCMAWVGTHRCAEVLVDAHADELQREERVAAARVLVHIMRGLAALCLSLLEH